MTAHNKAQLRYKILDRCFRDTSRDYTFSELLDTINEMLKETDIPHAISERQLYSDIAFMKSEAGFGAEIENYRVLRVDKFGRKRFISAYRYKDSKYSIDKIPLTHQQMRLVQTYLSSFDASIDANIEPWVKKTISRMKEWLGDFNARPIMRYDNNELQGGVRMKEVYDYLHVLLVAIDSQKSVLIHVKSFDKEMVYQFHPVFMKQYIHRWFVMGVTTENPEKVEAIPLDKIYGIEESSERYIHYPFNPEEYFEDIIGVDNPDSDPVDIHFIAYEWGAYYLYNNPIHSSQRSRWIMDGDQKALDVHIIVKINSGLHLTLDKFFSCIKILTPQVLIDRHINKLHKAINRHAVEV